MKDIITEEVHEVLLMDETPDEEPAVLTSLPPESSSPPISPEFKPLYEMCKRMKN